MCRYFVSIFVITLVFAFGQTQTFAQSSEENVEKLPPTECWDVYSECAAAAFGDEGWRSGCYADFTACFANQDVSSCEGEKLPKQCTEYQTQCLDFASENVDAKNQCVADLEVCKSAFGC